MNFEMEKTWSSIKEGTKEIAETAHIKTNEFHENYVSQFLPDCGKYGDAAKFVAEMAPGVSEYNAIVEGDWTAFAIAAGLDIGAIAIGAVTAGTGYAAFKGGSTVAKAGAKAAVKEVAEASAKKVVKEVAEEGAEKVVKEIAEAGSEKAVKELVEAGTEKITKEVVEASTEKMAREAAESSVQKAVKETVEDVAEKAVKPETLEKISPVVRNKLDGVAREEKVLSELLQKYKREDVIREALVRDAKGMPIKDIVTGEARKLDFVIKSGDKVTRAIEVTSESASKVFQIAKEVRIREAAEQIGGAFIKDPITGKLISLGKDVATEIWRLA